MVGKTIIGIDPAVAKPIAYSIWHGGKLRRTGKIENPVDILIKIDQFGMIPDMVVIEDQYLHRNYKTSKALTMMSGRIAGALDTRGYEWCIENVAKWQSAVGYRKGMSLTDHAMLYANTTGISDDDIAAAILIPARYITKFPLGYLYE